MYPQNILHQYCSNRKFQLHAFSKYSPSILFKQKTDDNDDEHYHRHKENMTQTFTTSHLTRNCKDEEFTKHLSSS